MINNIKQFIYWPAVILFLTCGIYSQTTEKTIAHFTKNMNPQNGFFKYYLDDNHGRIYLEISRFDDPFLYQVGLARGAGSNDIGLDRVKLGDTRLVQFEKVGNRVLLHQVNTKFRAQSKNPEERRAVRDSFASSVLWGFTTSARTRSGETVLIDITPFLLSDQFGISRQLNQRRQGDFRLDSQRSALYLPRTKNFPDNTEYETTLTFSGKKPGPFVRRVTPTPESLTLRQHISFIRLPDTDYTPRVYNVNSGFYATSYLDYASPIDKPLEKRFIQRHRLRKKNPGAPVSEPVKPIVYHVDPGTPEPVRSALLEGARWWNKAFEAAGYKNAFQVKLLPPDADPMDVRYNVINWVHRSTRGWSYGGSITDPRTGEIIKGHVTLGSLRVRQDVLIAQGILTPYSGDNKDVSTMKEMALARIRQLSAHEVGHTLGLTHNYASSRDNRASVMDYPHPLIRLTEDNTLDFSRAYTEGIGEWDKVTICYGYGEIPAGRDESVYLQSIIDDAFAKGLTFISDPDSQGTGNLHAYSHLWDNGKDPLTEFKRLRWLRRYALEKFSTGAIPLGEPMSSLEEVLVPLYFSHRYQVEAVGKMIGGMTYSYAVRSEEPQTAYTLIAPELQNEAVDALMETLSAKFLALPERILSLIPPKALGYRRSDESFPHHTGRSFDALAMTEASANFTMEILLHPQRAARLVEFRARDKRFPGFVELLDRISGFTVRAKQTHGIAGAIHRRVNHVYIHHLMLLVSNHSASEAVCSPAMFHLMELKIWLEDQLKRALSDNSYKAHYYYEAHRIDEFLNGRYMPKPDELAKMPPGSPI